MRRIFYGAATVVTTDDVADALVRLTVAVANFNQTEAVSFPVVADSSGGVGTAQVVLGAGIALMTGPIGWDGEEPDFSTGATLLRMHSYFPYRDADPGRSASPIIEPDPWDPELEGY